MHFGRPLLERQDGFSLFELVVVVVIVALLMVAAINRLLGMQAEAERVSMETVVGTLRSALGMKVAESIVRHELPMLSALEGSNPMERLAERPQNYLGELANPDPATLESGNWYFDTARQELVYLVRNKTNFSGGQNDPPRARFAVRLVYTDRNKNARYDNGLDSIEGVRLAVIEPYRWTH